jgi:uncharacterized protein (UPF0248 family)
MIPIQDLLHRILWDPAYGHAAFEIGYLDRVAKRIVRVPMQDLRVKPGEGLTLEAEGIRHTIPLHRVREVWREDVLIWERRPAPRRART